MIKTIYITVLLTITIFNTMAQVEQGSPAYNEYTTLQRHLKSVEKYKLKSNFTNMKTYMSFALKSINKIKDQYPDTDISAEEKSLAEYQSFCNKGQSNGSNVQSKAKGFISKMKPSGNNGHTEEADRDYFRNMHMNLNTIYSETDYGADVTSGLKFTSTHKNLEKTIEVFKNFSKVEYLERVAKAKSSEGYAGIKFYIEKVVEALNDYPRFITNSRATYKEYIGYLENIGVKGDPSMELLHLKATKQFCELLLKFAPNNSTASQWVKEVDSQMSKISGGISYESAMHQKHMGEMLFSNKEVVVGSENESDFQKDFKSGDFIFATIYLPSKVRALTDSYAANDMLIKIDGSILSEGSMSPVWITTEMQDKNYLQFAIIPNAEWKQKYSSYYIDNKIRTHEHIAGGLLRIGPYSGTPVEVKVTFRGTSTSVKGNFTIDLSGGTDYLKSIVSGEENARLGEQKLPKAGMSNSNLENQALTIMNKKSAGSGKTYHKAIVTSPNWDYDKTWNGVVVSRSISVALVSTEHDGKCMYQYFNFMQQAQGNGSFNDNLEFNGAGDNFYLSCENAK